MIPFIIYAFSGPNNLCINDSYEKTLNTLDYFYYSIVTLTTLGYGDIYPCSIATKWAVIVQSIAGPGLIGLFLVAIANDINKRREEEYNKREVTKRTEAEVEDKIKSHDKRQRLYRDFLRVHTEIFNLLELGCDDTQLNFVCFYKISDKEVHTLRTPYYDFNRNLSIAETYYSGLLEEINSNHNLIHKIQRLIDFHVEMLEGMVNRAYHYEGVDQKYIDNAVISIRNGTALHYRVLQIENMAEREQDYARKEYVEALYNFINETSACIRVLTQRTSIRILTNDVIHESSFTVSEEERGKFLESIDTVQTNQLISEWHSATSGIGPRWE